MVKPKNQKVKFKKRISSTRKKRSLNIRGFLMFIITLVIVAGIGIGLVRIKFMFIDSDYFIIKEGTIKLHDGSSFLKDLQLSEISDGDIIGKNIFFLDLAALKKDIESNHPEFKDIVIRRLLPNKLIVKAELRKSVAQIRSDRYYLVDREGVLLNDVRNFPDPELPIIAGIGVNFAKVDRPNFAKFEKDKLAKALELINDITENKDLSKYKVKLVDMNDPGNVSFSLDQAIVEIKIGNTDFRDRLAKLATVLNEIGVDINDFKYIDLRFEDPIVGYK
ncbi:MAG: cell division protein FtsQ/DivIB [Candidatus Omnitrophota bacterium]